LLFSIKVNNLLNFYEKQEANDMAFAPGPGRWRKLEQMAEGGFS